MSHFLLIDKAGWVIGYHNGLEPKLFFGADKSVEVVDGAAALSLASKIPLVWLQPETTNFFFMVRDRKKQWYRIRKDLMGEMAVQHFKTANELPDLPLKDIPDIPVDEPSPVQRRFEPLFEGEIFPGLEHRISRESEVDIWEKALLPSLKEDAWLKAAGWLSDPDCWPIITLWNGTPLRVQCYRFNMDGTVTGLFTSNLKNLPRWFWTRFQRGLFDALDQHGFERMDFVVPKTLQSYIGHLVDVYKARKLYGKESDENVRMRYHIPTTLAGIPDWPEPYNQKAFNLSEIVEATRRLQC